MIKAHVSATQTFCPRLLRCHCINKLSIAVSALKLSQGRRQPLGFFHSDKDGLDDSSSMRRENRWQSQKELVERIAKITTRVLPQSEGVALRFINQEVSNSSSLGLDDIGKIFEPPMNWDKEGNTEIGTYLRSKILKPLVYDKLDSVPKKFERPLLISIITDSQPKPEPRATLKNAIVECRRKLDDVNYPRESEYSPMHLCRLLIVPTHRCEIYDWSDWNVEFLVDFSEYHQRR